MSCEIQTIKIRGTPQNVTPECFNRPFAWIPAKTCGNDGTEFGLEAGASLEMVLHRSGSQH
jgi:hypothetical protein